MKRPALLRSLSVFLLLFFLVAGLAADVQAQERRPRKPDSEVKKEEARRPARSRRGSDEEKKEEKKEAEEERRRDEAGRSSARGAEREGENDDDRAARLREQLDERRRDTDRVQERQRDDRNPPRRDRDNHPRGGEVNRGVERNPSYRRDPQDDPRIRDAERRDRERDLSRHNRDDARYRNEYRYDRRHYRPSWERGGVKIHIQLPRWVHIHHHRPHRRYVYKQVVYVDAAYGGRRYDHRLDVRTRLYQRIRDVDRNSVTVDLEIEGLEIYDRGRFVGEVNRIPSNLGTIRATIYRNGRIAFDRMVYLVGDPQVGFEMISTRHYDGFVYNNYRRDHGLRVGRVDLWRGRVVRTSHSRLFDPQGFNGFAPISLLPDDDYWVDRAWSAAYGDYYGDRDYDRYYYGSDYGYGDDDDYGDDYGYYGSAPDYSSEDTRVAPGQPFITPDGQVESPEKSSSQRLQPFRRQSDNTFQTEQGASFRIRREVEIEEVGDGAPRKGN